MNNCVHIFFPKNIKITYKIIHDNIISKILYTILKILLDEKYDEYGEIKIKFSKLKITFIFE